MLLKSKKEEGAKETHDTCLPRAMANKRREFLLFVWLQTLTFDVNYWFQQMRKTQQKIKIWMHKNQKAEQRQKNYIALYPTSKADTLSIGKDKRVSISYGSNGWPLKVTCKNLPKRQQMEPIYSLQVSKTLGYTLSDIWDEFMRLVSLNKWNAIVRICISS